MDALQQIIFLPIGGFLVIFIGTLLLFGEVLVKGRFLFAITGLLTISAYFSAHVQEGLAFWIVGIYLVGILLVVLDGKVIGDGTLAGIGIILMLIALALPSPTLLYGLLVITAFVLGTISSSLFLKLFPRRDLWSKLALHDALTSEEGYNSMNQEYAGLVGKQGIADTDFRPSGSILVDGKMYSAISEGKWIKKGTRIVVQNVDGTRILIKPSESTE